MSRLLKGQPQKSPLKGERESVIAELDPRWKLGTHSFEIDRMGHVDENRSLRPDLLRYLYRLGDREVGPVSFETQAIED